LYLTRRKRLNERRSRLRYRLWRDFGIRLLQRGLALPAVSANGKYIAYLSNATNLSDTNSGGSKVNVFLYDRGADTSNLVSHHNGAATSGNGDASTVAISADGSTIAFTSNATDLLPTAITTSADTFRAPAGAGDAV